jgi:hypothetical protein
LSGHENGADDCNTRQGGERGDLPPPSSAPLRSPAPLMLAVFTTISFSTDLTRARCSPVAPPGLLGNGIHESTQLDPALKVSMSILRAWTSLSLIMTVFTRAVIAASSISSPVLFVVGPPRRRQPCGKANRAEGLQSGWFHRMLLPGQLKTPSPVSEPSSRLVQRIKLREERCGPQQESPIRT